MSFGKKERFYACLPLECEWLLDCQMFLPLRWGEGQGEGEGRTQSELPI
jgi:hypothetical protein